MSSVKCQVSGVREILNTLHQQVIKGDRNMSIPYFSIRRPVTITMIFIGVVLLGWISWTKLPRELFPAITYPQITVVSRHEHAAPEEIETLITRIIEEATGTVSNIRRISSISKEGISKVFLEFVWGTNMDFASLDVREKIDLIKARLPLGAGDPIVMKHNPFEMPILILSVTGEISPLALREICRKIIKTEIEKVPGVASANITGGRQREILVELDQGRLAATNTSILEVVSSLREANFTFPAGTIKESFYEYLIRTMGRFEHTDEIKDTVVNVIRINPPETRFEWHLEQQEQFVNVEKRAILISDVGSVSDTLKEQTSISRHNGRENVSIAIQRQSGANALMVATRVRTVLGKLEESGRLPQGVSMDIVYDQSEFIRNSINGVRDAAIGGGILAFFVLLFFLKNVKSSIIVTCSIPISIMAAFSLMYFRNISINMMSLGGLALGVGMLVDNAIVVIENIFRHRQSGKHFKKCVSDGASEVSNAVTASTLTTICVFLPLIFVIGIAGQLFKELAFTVTFSLLASLGVALSLIPRLVATGKEKLQKNELNPVRKDFSNGVKKERNYILTEDREEFKKMRNFYTRVLANFLSYKFVGLGVIVLIFIFSIGLLFELDRELLPKIDQREFIINVTLPTGARLDVTDSIVKRIEKNLFELNDVEGVSVVVGSVREGAIEGIVETLGSHQARLIVSLKEMSRRNPEYRTSQEVIRSLEQKLLKENLKNAHIEFILQESVFKTAFQGAKPVIVEIKGENLNILRNLAEEVEDRLVRIAGIHGITSSLTPPQPELRVHPIKDRAAFYNLSVNDIAFASQVAIKGHVATRFKEEGREYPIRVKLRERDRNNMARLRRILIHSPHLNINVPLAEVAYFNMGTGPSQIERLNQERVVTVSANIFKRAFNDVAEDVETFIANMNIPRGYLVNMGGEREEMQESFNSLRFALILAIVLVYMIMAAQFESLWQPFVIMFTVPLSMIGVACFLYITGTSLNVIVILGVIMLGGIVVNNGIVLIDNVNLLRRKEGLDAYNAVINAGKNRLRPILMTATTTVLGLTPLALGFGDGAELRAPMAIAVIGGLISSTFLTLVVIPALYIIADGMIESASMKGFSLSIPSVSEIKEKIKISLKKPAFQKTVEIQKTAEIQETKSLKLSEQIKAKPELIEPKPNRINLEFKLPQDINSRQRKAIAYILENNKLTRKQYTQLFKVSIATAARDLKELLDRKLVCAEGPLGPGRWYEIAEEI